MVIYLSIEPVTLGSYITSQLITIEAFLDRVGDNRSPLGKPSCIQDRRYTTNPSSGWSISIFSRSSAFKWINMCFSSAGTLPVVSKVHLFKASEHPLPPCGHTPQCTSGQQQAHYLQLESDLSLPPSSLVLLLPTQHRHGGNLLHCWLVPLQLQQSLELENASSHKCPAYPFIDISFHATTITRGK